MCVISVHTVVLLKYNNLFSFKFMYSVCGTPIPCFRDVICSVKTVCKAERNPYSKIGGSMRAILLNPRGCLTNCIYHLSVKVKTSVMC